MLASPGLELATITRFSVIVGDETKLPKPVVFQYMVPPIPPLRASLADTLPSADVIYNMPSLSTGLQNRPPTPVPVLHKRLLDCAPCPSIIL